MLKGGSWKALEGTRVVHMEVEVVPATLTRMDIFDKLQVRGAAMYRFIETL